MRKLSTKWVPFFGVIQTISCHDWWPWMKPGYVTMAWRQSNSQWSGDIVAHPAPENSECKICWKSSRPNFLGSRWHPLRWFCSKWPNYQHGLLLFSADAIEGQFKKKTLQESHQGRLFSCTTMPQLTGHLQPRRNWFTWLSRVLITHPILWI